MTQDFYCDMYNHCGHCPKWTGVDCKFDLSDEELAELEQMLNEFDYDKEV